MTQPARKKETARQLELLEAELAAARKVTARYRTAMEKAEKRHEAAEDAQAVAQYRFDRALVASWGDERDNAESALNDAYKAVMGQAPEWSNWFSFANAIDEIELACEQWRNQTDDVIQFRQRIAELEARKYIPQPLDIEDECQSYEYVAGWNDCRDAASVRQQTPAVCDVIAERFRQQSVEGWTLEHDDQYGKSQLLWASSCYLLNTIQPFNRIPMDWPWDSSWWKPTNPRRDLVKACALIIAEIERRDRAAGIKVKG